MTRYGLRTRSFIPLALAALGLAVSVAPAAAAAPTIQTFVDGPFDDLLADCGTYEIREITTITAKEIAYADGTTRILVALEGSLYRSDDPDTIVGREYARIVRVIDGTVAHVTGNRWHIVVTGEGMVAHDVGRLVVDFDTREVFALSGLHSIFDGEFDFGSFCA